MSRNGKNNKGGRPKGSKSNHTIQAEEYRNYLVQEVIKQKGPLTKALIDKGLTGDIPALKEIHERALGKVTDKVDIGAGESLLEALKLAKKMENE